MYGTKINLSQDNKCSSQDMLCGQQVLFEDTFRK